MQFIGVLTIGLPAVIMFKIYIKILLTTYTQLLSSNNQQQAIYRASYIRARKRDGCWWEL